MMQFIKKHKVIISVISLILVASLMFYFISANIADELLIIYNNRQSVAIRDRNNKTLLIKPNKDGYWAEYINAVPKEFENMLLFKEDKYFYFHPGINPVSTGRAVVNWLARRNRLASSTITQQLVKILLGNENNRSIKNKVKEMFCALAMEAQVDKNKILQMYINSIYLGNNVQGLKTASRLYFDVSPAYLSDGQILKILATISNPANNSPFDAANAKSAQNLGKRLGIMLANDELTSGQDSKALKERFRQYVRNKNYFELENLLSLEQNGDKNIFFQIGGRSCFIPSPFRNHLMDNWNKYVRQNTETPPLFLADCGEAYSASARTGEAEAHAILTVDNDLSDKLREILKRNLDNLALKKATNGAIIVINYPNNELLALIGSPNPTIDAYGYKINMATKPRAIGSTIKPFIYLKGFEKNLRPYTEVNDREYKYLIGDGYAFYPKNYDYQYHGRVNLHYALSNSLNVPTVKVLEYYGINDFYNFLQNDLGFQPVQNIKNYELGIALGGLEMDLLTLSHYFSIFANHGQLRSLQFISPSSARQALKGLDRPVKKISSEPYIDLVNSILSDRVTGAEQFGLTSDLNLPYKNYAVKTGTSKDYRDSWTIGYTPDFLVGVWVGNSDNSSMDKVSGSSGAGKIWREAMNLLYNSPYNRNTPFKFDGLIKYTGGAGFEYGLAGDDYDEFKNLLTGADQLSDRFGSGRNAYNLILKPHEGDEYLLEKGMKINLTASEEVEWLANGKSLGFGREKIFTPDKIGTYSIKARVKDKEQEIKIFIDEEK